VLRKNAKLELLRRVPLFEACSKRELQQIGALADELRLPEGRMLIEEGARGREFFALVEGEVDVRQGGRKLRTLSGGDFFGELALLTDAPRSATVTATSPVRVLVITDRAFAGLMRDVPTIQRKVLAALADRLAPESV
jgi:CRP-like cAMP-binding protein